MQSNRLKLVVFLVGFIACCCWGYSQSFILPANKKFEKIRFQLVNNVMVIPVELNGSKLSFILDSGVGSPILFNLSDQDSVQINDVSRITLKGLGEGEPIQALKSENNQLLVGDAFNKKQSMYVILDKDINFSTSLGIPIHGIVGYDLFKSFVVEVNYAAQVIKLHASHQFKKRKNEKEEMLPLVIKDRKAYVDGFIATDKEEVPVKLLVDTGSSDALWLFHDPEKGLAIPEKNYEDFLGRGLSGNIFGKRTKIEGLKLGSFLLTDAKVAFPYKESFSAIKNLGDRNGSVGGEVLKRFNIIFDYQKKKMYLKKNTKFGEPFQYNLSGIDLQHNGLRYIAERITDNNGVVQENQSDTFGTVQILMENQTRLSLVPEIVVSGIRAGSPAAEAGLQEGDVILAINGKQIHKYKLQEVFAMLNEKKGKRIRVLIERYNKDLLFSFTLKDVFDK